VERERRLFDERFVTVRDDHGAVVITALLDPESAPVDVRA